MRKGVAIAEEKFTMAKIVIFGTLDTASLAHFYLKHDSEHDVVAFTVHQQYMPDVENFEGLPIIPFEQLSTFYPPSTYSFFAPMTGRQMSKTRAGIYQQAKAQGYTCISYVSSKATLFPGAQIGENCFILEDNTIQPFTTVGHNVVMWSGNHIGHHGVIHDHVFFTSHVVLSGHCIVEPYCWFGVNATIRDYTHLAEGTLIAMGACLTKQETEPWSVYMGVPAKKASMSSLEANK
jgi:sugar O-acyltransferase (sialic acid O-acetyltransferase NeuD family)